MMTEMELREQIMSCKDRYFVMNNMRPTWIEESNRFLKVMLTRNHNVIA